MNDADFLDAICRISNITRAEYEWRVKRINNLVDVDGKTVMQAIEITREEKKGKPWLN